MPTWVDVLVDPPRAGRAARLGAVQDEKWGFSLLMQGRLLEYSRQAEEGKWSAVDSELSLDSRSLLDGLRTQIAGSDVAITLYERIATDNAMESDLRTAAAVLASVAMSDLGNYEEALTLLTAVADDLNSLHRAFIFLHKAFRHGEKGDFERASSLIDEALSFLKAIAARQGQAGPSM
jgi:hypothetical protein